MNLTLNLPPDIETILCAEAATNGMDVAAYVGRLLDEAVRRRSSSVAAAVDQWESDLRRFVDGLPRPVAPVPADATRRFNFYEDAS